MDDLAHDFPLNHRKRKADSNDDPQQQPPKKPIVATDPSQQSQEGFSNAPRQPWIATDSGDTLWSPQVSSPLSAEVVHGAYSDASAKRPRLDKFPPPPPHSPGKRSTKRMTPAKSILSKLQAIRHGSDLEDIGIISTADPGPSSGSLLRARSSFSSKHADSLPRLSPIYTVDFNSPHFPSLQSLINRQTLKELDLDAIMRNPQLRHDLLFDPGLQFRPTCSRRKRDLSERYWAAVTHEIETGCTCVSFDALGKPHPAICICAHAPRATTSPPPVYPATPSVFTVRMQSRIRGLLTEFLEVLLLVIQPLSTISGIYVNAAKFKAQMEEHSAQAAFLRSVFDPALIEQELEHGLFDPSGLFRTIGVTLKKHCAPMRDSAVESMVHAAQSCAPGGPGTKADAVKAVRMCMEILELMKLDIANHQLQALRPFLIRTAGQFELKTLKNRSGGEGSLHLTREWIHNAHDCLVSRSQPLTHPHYPDHLNFNTLSRNQQIYISVLKGIVDVVFNPPPAISSTSSPPASPLTPNSPVSFSAFPETFHLDTSRLLHFNSDATDVTSMYMFLLLYRQLINSDPLEPGSHDRPKVSDCELTRLKREIRDIANTKLGVCFSASSSVAGAADLKNGSETEKWMEIKQNVVLQIAKRAKDARCQSNSTTPSLPVGEAPDERLLNIAQRWADSTMQPGSSLSVMLHDRLRETVFNAVVGLTYPGPNGSAPSVHSLPVSKSEFSTSLPLNLASGMEPLADEIRSLSEKISRLAIIHLNAYLPLYEKVGFLRP